MLHRFAVMVAGIALAAGSIAPAQVAPAGATPVASPAIAMNVALPKTPAPEPLIVTPAIVDPLSPAQEPEAPLEPEQPEISRSASLAEKVAEFRSTEPGSRELECLAVAVYFESKSEPLSGQLAVGQVMANRANSKGRFPSSYCGVLFQRGQFSFVRGGRWPAVNRQGTQWKIAVAIARIVDRKMHDGPVPKALFFHARRVSPGWKLTRVGSVGNHVFYR